MTTQELVRVSGGEAAKHHLIPLHGESSRLYAAGARERHPIGSLYGVGTQHAEAFRSIGIETVEDLLRIEELEGLDESTGVPTAILRKTRLRAESYVSMETYQTHPFEFPAEHQIFIDIETDIYEPLGDGPFVGPEMLPYEEFIARYLAGLTPEELIAHKNRPLPELPRRSSEDPL